MEVLNIAQPDNPAGLPAGAASWLAPFHLKQDYEASMTAHNKAYVVRALTHAVLTFPLLLFPRLSTQLTISLLLASALRKDCGTVVQRGPGGDNTW